MGRVGIHWSEAESERQRRWSNAERSDVTIIRLTIGASASTVLATMVVVTSLPSVDSASRRQGPSLASFACLHRK